MPYQFKDNQNNQYSKKWKYIIAGISVFIIITSIFRILTSYSTDYQAFLNLGLACFVIWGTWFNGYYKIMRWYAGRQTKNKDNKFDYFHT